MRTIIIADNQDITKNGWLYLIDKHTNDVNITTVSNKKDLLQHLIECPDSLVILDYTLFDIASINELQIMEMRFDKVDWILFSDDLSVAFIKLLLQNTHSFGVLLKNCDEIEILTALKETLKRNRFICNQISNTLLESNSNHSVETKQVLTSTEQEILKEIALGRTTKEIASKRFVSIHTIVTHRKNIFRKIEVNNVHEATKYAFKAGIIDIAEYNI